MSYFMIKLRYEIRHDLVSNLICNLFGRYPLLSNSIQLLLQVGLISNNFGLFEFFFLNFKKPFPVTFSVCVFFLLKFLGGLST